MRFWRRRSFREVHRIETLTIRLLSSYLDELYQSALSVAKEVTGAELLTPPIRLAATGGEICPVELRTGSALGEQQGVRFDTHTSSIKQLIITVEPTTAPLQPTGSAVLVSS